MWVDKEGEGGMKVCPDCLGNYKRSRAGRKARLARKEGGAWGKGKWPTWAYHSEATRKCRAHHAYDLSYSSARRHGRRNATPPWADLRAIRAIYEDCIATTQRTGIRHEVDHIIPLRGELVSGLHVHSNLRVITRAENSAKSNKILPEFA